jgi:sulfofructose kinase
MASLICLGIVVRDLVFRVPALPLAGGKLTAKSLTPRGGGMAATAAVAAAALGGEVEFWGRLGDDAQGREFRAELQSCGVKVRTASPAGTQTPTSAVLVADNGERLLAVYPGRLEESVIWLPLERVAGVQAVHADFRWPAGAESLYQAAAQHRLPRVLDADVGDAQALRRLLPLCNHAVFSQAGLAELSGTSVIEAGLANAAQLSPGVVAVTLGERGSAFLVDGQLHRVAAQTVKARDTNGAGDVFHGAYAFALARGDRVLDAARFASAAAALKCSNGSGWGAAPALDAVMRLLKAGQR